MNRLSVKGMTCEHCERTVREALAVVPGVVRVVRVDREAGQAEVEGDADPEALVKALAEVGFSAEVRG